MIVSNSYTLTNRRLAVIESMIAKNKSTRNTEYTLQIFESNSVTTKSLQ